VGPIPMIERNKYLGSGWSVGTLPHKWIEGVLTTHTGNQKDWRLDTNARKIGSTRENHHYTH
jgi:hypothetical protein